MPLSKRHGAELVALRASLFPRFSRIRKLTLQEIEQALVARVVLVTGHHVSRVWNVENLERGYAAL